MEYSKRLPAHNTLAELCLSATAKYNKKLAFAMLCDGKINREISFTQFGERAKGLASLLIHLGIKKGDRILLLSENCPEWAITYFGITLAGAVSVPLLTGFSGEQIQYIASHSGIAAVCTSTAMADKLKHPDFPKVPRIIINNLP